MSYFEVQSRDSVSPIAKSDGSSLRYDGIAAKIDENARAIADTAKTCCTFDHRITDIGRTRVRNLILKRLMHSRDRYRDFRARMTRTTPMKIL